MRGNAGKISKKRAPVCYDWPYPKVRYARHGACSGSCGRGESCSEAALRPARERREVGGARKGEGTRAPPCACLRARGSVTLFFVKWIFARPACDQREQLAGGVSRVRRQSGYARGARYPHQRFYVARIGRRLATLRRVLSHLQYGFSHIFPWYQRVLMASGFFS